MFNFISGEKIQSKCLTLIVSQTDYNRSSKLNENVKEIKDIDSTFNNPYKIFCYSDYLNNIDFLISVLKKFQNDFILVFHNSDKNFESEHLILFNNLNKLKKIYTQNCSMIHSNVEPIPIGIANSMWNHGNLEILNEIVTLNIVKSNKIYFNFDINTNFSKRQICKDICSNKNIQWNNKKDFKNYLSELKSHYYAICPDGNGLDTHRLWECFYLNVIPICLKNSFLEYFKEKFNFNIILLNNWDELNVEKLELKESSNNEKIKLYEEYLFNVKLK
jgi:hypothetical protein